MRIIEFDCSDSGLTKSIWGSTDGTLYFAKNDKIKKVYTNGATIKLKYTYNFI